MVTIDAEQIKGAAMTAPYTERGKNYDGKRICNKAF